jgi:hypothetical protein
VNSVIFMPVLLTLHAPSVGTGQVAVTRGDSLGIRRQYPIGHKTPAHEHQPALTGVAIEADNWLEGLRRYIPTWPKVRQNGSVYREEFCDLLLIGSAGVVGTVSRFVLVFGQIEV